MFFAATCSLGYKYSYRSKDGGRGWDWGEGTNPSGRTGVEIKCCNGTGKTIKYLIFTCIPYNQVNDAVSCNVTGAVAMRFKVTGPIAPCSDTSDCLFIQIEDGWYNPTIKSVKITKVEILYMDGSSETLSEQQLAANMRVFNHQYQQQLPQLQRQELKEKFHSCLVLLSLWGLVILILVLFVTCVSGGK